MELINIFDKFEDKVLGAKLYSTQNVNKGQEFAVKVINRDGISIVIGLALGNINMNDKLTLVDIKNEEIESEYGHPLLKQQILVKKG